MQLARPWRGCAVRFEYELMRSRLTRDGLLTRPFMLIGCAMVWRWPEGGYRRVLDAYAQFMGDAPERIHAELCRCLLAAGKEIGPEEYFGRLRKELVWDAD